MINLWEDKKNYDGQIKNILYNTRLFFIYCFFFALESI